MNVMRQPNRYDCGVLSIAAITDIALGFNPAKSVWDINKMRSHLISCFEKKKMERFPILKQRRIPFGSAVIYSHLEEIFCYCRMPYDKAVDMILCELCALWFHNNCVEKKQLVIAIVSHYMEVCGLVISLKSMNLWVKITKIKLLEM